VEFANVSAAVLANRGIELGEPKSPPSLSEAEAAAFASEAHRGADVLESRYAHCRDVSKHPPIDQDCWAFLLDPSRQRFTMGGTTPTFSLVLVDPVSGEILLDQIGRGDIEPSLLPPDPRLGPG
jgi:hypothetical protein